MRARSASAQGFLLPKSDLLNQRDGNVEMREYLCMHLYIYSAGVVDFASAEMRREFKPVCLRKSEMRFSGENSLYIVCFLSGFFVLCCAAIRSAVLNG